MDGDWVMMGYIQDGLARLSDQRGLELGVTEIVEEGEEVLDKTQLTSTSISLAVHCETLPMH